MVATSMSIGQKIQQGIDNAIEAIEQYKCYHRDFGSRDRLHFNIKMYNYRLPTKVQQMVDDGYLDEERVWDAIYQARAWELESFIEGMQHNELETSPYTVTGPITLWFDAKAHGKGQNVYQCGRSGGYLNVPMPSAYYYHDYGTWEDAAELIKVAAQVERFAQLVEHVKTSVDQSLSDDDGLLHMLIEDEWEQYQQWKEERDTPEPDEDDQY